MQPTPIVYGIELLGEHHFLSSVRGTESVSAPFRFACTFWVPSDHPLAVDDAPRSAAALVLQRSAEVRRITGVVTSLVRYAAVRGKAMGSRVDVVLEPSLVLARLRQDIRVFREKDAPTIVQEVLGGLGIRTARRLSGSYAKRDYCVEWRESDFDFAARLLEDEGIFHFIDPEGTVILGDSVGAYDPSLGTIPFQPDAGLDEGRDTVTTFGWRGRITAGKVTLRDFNHEHPSLNMDVQAKGPYGAGPEWYDYPGEYALPPEGAAKAGLRAQALECAYQRAAGTAFAPELRPGVRFTLGDGPEGGASEELVVLAVTHEWDRDKAGFVVAFEAMAATRVFRPLCSTRVPTIVNPLTGFVTGPAGEDIHTDEWGRVKVHFPWDRLQPKDDTCSHWIPVLQDNTGHSSSMSRVGWEVACHYLEGDPDRPVVMGRVYNPDDHFHERLPVGKTRTSIRSETSPRTEEGGENKIQFEDAAGSQYLFIQAQKDQNVVVVNDRKEQVDETEQRFVLGNELHTIGTEQRIQVKKDIAPVVEGTQTEVIGASRKMQIKGEATEQIKGDHKVAIGGSHKRMIGQIDSVVAKGNLTEAVGGLVLEGSVKVNTSMIDRVSAVLVGGAHIELVKDTKSEIGGKARAETIGAILFGKAGDEGFSTMAGKQRRTMVGMALKVSAVKEVVLAGLTKVTAKAAQTEFTLDESATFKVGSSEVIIGDGVIAFKCDETIQLKATAKNLQGAEKSKQI